MKMTHFRFIRTISAFYLPGNRRIGENSPADHYTLYFRKLFRKITDIFFRCKISVITYFMPSCAERFFKHIHMRIIFIKIFLCTGMNDQLFYRILIINIHKFRKFLTTFCSDPRFYRNIDRAILKHFFQKKIQTFRKC